MCVRTLLTLYAAFTQRIMFTRVGRLDHHRSSLPSYSPGKHRCVSPGLGGAWDQRRFHTLFSVHEYDWVETGDGGVLSQKGAYWDGYDGGLVSWCRDFESLAKMQTGRDGHLDCQHLEASGLGRRPTWNCPLAMDFQRAVSTNLRFFVLDNKNTFTNYWDSRRTYNDLLGKRDGDSVYTSQ